MATQKNLKVSKGLLKAKMFEYLRIVESSGEALEVTDRGVSTCIILPIKKTKSLESIFEPYQGKLKVVGDLLESENEEWGELA